MFYCNLGRFAWKLRLESSLRNVTFWECFEEKKFGEIFVGVVFDFLFLCGEGLFEKIGCMECCTYHA
jgi:hypothetical protein